MKLPNDNFDAATYRAENDLRECTADLQSMGAAPRLLHLTGYVLADLIEIIRDGPPVGAVSILVHQSGYDEVLNTQHASELLEV